jgi:hypothetical protein
MKQNSVYTNELKTAREEEEELIFVDNSVTPRSNSYVENLIPNTSKGDCTYR